MTKKKSKQKSKQKPGTKTECKTCRGYGLWRIGDHSPMGEIDAFDGLPSIKCPECGAGGKIKRNN